MWSLYSPKLYVKEDAKNKFISFFKAKYLYCNINVHQLNVLSKAAPDILLQCKYIHYASISFKMLTEKKMLLMEKSICLITNNIKTSSLLLTFWEQEKKKNLVLQFYRAKFAHIRKPSGNFCTKMIYTSFVFCTEITSFFVCLHWNDYNPSFVVSSLLNHSAIPLKSGVR